MVTIVPGVSIDLREITRREIERYAGYSPQANLYPILDDQNQTYTVVAIPHWPRKFPATLIVLARIAGDKIIIEEDTTLDKPLVDALMSNAGVPREQIILAYTGESVLEGNQT
jgi:hypothetical protein